MKGAEWTWSSTPAPAAPPLLFSLPRGVCCVLTPEWVVKGIKHGCIPSGLEHHPLVGEEPPMHRKQRLIMQPSFPGVSGSVHHSRHDVNLCLNLPDTFLPPYAFLPNTSSETTQ